MYSYHDTITLSTAFYVLLSYHSAPHCLHHSSISIPSSLTFPSYPYITTIPNLHPILTLTLPIPYLTHTLLPAPISGDASAAFKTTIDGQIIVLLMTLCVILNINTDGFKDPSGNPVWSLIRMKLLPQLSNKLTTYDATEKKTVPPEQSTAAIRANITMLGRYS